MNECDFLCPAYMNWLVSSGACPSLEAFGCLAVAYSWGGTQDTHPPDRDRILNVRMWFWPVVLSGKLPGDLGE